MGKHVKGEDLNSKPFDRSASPEQKAKEFDEQYAQNNNKARGSIERRSGRHAK